MTLSNEITDSEYIILENIYDSAENSLKQRELSRIAGTSLGMTNAILKRLTRKGWITIKKLNSRNIQYAVTLEGLNEIMHRSYRYFKNTIKNAVYYKDILEETIRNVQAKGVLAVILVGSSDLDFIVEHACRRYGMTLFKTQDLDSPNIISDASLGGAFRVYAETITAELGDESNRISGGGDNALYLSRLVMKQAAELR
jgi:DNA-binding MarR family transcriptional regulator